MKKQGSSISIWNINGKFVICILLLFRWSWFYPSWHPPVTHFEIILICLSIQNLQCNFWILRYWRTGGWMLMTFSLPFLPISLLISGNKMCCGNSHRIVFKMFFLLNIYRISRMHSSFIHCCKKHDFFFFFSFKTYLVHSPSTIQFYQSSE